MQTTIAQHGVRNANAANKKRQIWQRDSLSVEISNTTFAKQKLEYIYFNPLRWQMESCQGLLGV